MRTYFNIVEAIVAIILIVVVLVQVRGSGAGVFGSAQSTFRTRRGIERTLFQFTIVLAVLFIAISLAGVLLG